MPITITRTSWTDDDGSGQTGTVINNAEKTALYDQIDTALALAAAKNELNTFTAFGTHTFSASGANGNIISLENGQSSGNAFSRFLLRAHDGAALADIGHLAAFSSTSAYGGVTAANGVLLQAEKSGGLSLAATHASGVIRFFANGSSEIASLSSSVYNFSNAPMKMREQTPAAAGAGENGRLIIDGATPGRLVFYQGGVRYQVTGTSF